MISSLWCIDQIKMNNFRDSMTAFLGKVVHVDLFFMHIFKIYTLQKWLFTKPCLFYIKGNLFWTSLLKWASQAVFVHAKRGFFIDPLMPSQKGQCCAELQKPLNWAMANNEPSLLNLQQALIGFKVMKKTTWSIIIKALCHCVRARPCAATVGPSIEAMSWGQPSIVQHQHICSICTWPAPFHFRNTAWTSS